MEKFVSYDSHAAKVISPQASSPFWNSKLLLPFVQLIKLYLFVICSFCIFRLGWFWESYCMFVWKGFYHFWHASLSILLTLSNECFDCSTGPLTGSDFAVTPDNGSKTRISFKVGCYLPAKHFRKFPA